MKDQGLGPSHPERVGVEYGLNIYQAQLEEIPQPPPPVLDRTPDFSQLLPSLVISLICATLAITLIRKARTQQRALNS